MQVALLINIKWFIRIILLGFWVVAGVMAWRGQGFITWLFNEHASTCLVILFLSFHYLVSWLYAPFVQIKKQTQGGDVLMEKATKIMLVLIAILLSVTVAVIAFPGAREAIITGANNSIFKPAMGAWLGFVNWLDGVRGIHLLISGLAGGLGLAVFINKIALPKVRGTAKKIPKPYMGAPDYVPPSVVATPPAKPLASPSTPELTSETEETE